jgi:4-hydroxybenzoate polyprenyltransferase
MNEDRNIDVEENRQPELRTDYGIGTGRKTALYGCGFLILAVVVVFIILVFTGAYNPFTGTENVGP